MTQETAAVLLVDDDPAVAKVLEALLRQEGIGSIAVQSGAAALSRLELQPFDVVVTDLRMPGMDGSQLLAKILEQWPEQAVVMLTAHGTVATAVDAMKVGARDFLVKPFDADEVVAVVRRAMSVAGRATEAASLPSLGSTNLIGTSSTIREVTNLIERAARSVATVLIRGESGTGKELVARAIHDLGGRKGGPFVTLHCAALPDSLLESELFGYEKGAFTGATTRKPGRVELADKGTLFLDEIGDVPLATQVKLLRVLQEREFERVGGTHPVKVDVRFVAATHRDLEAMVQKGDFREDLYYRLNVVPLHVPPLRERPGDVDLLARHFFAVLAKANDRVGLSLSGNAVDRLSEEVWPGNVRQLQNFIERLIVMSDGPALGLTDVERELGRERAPSTLAPRHAVGGGEVTNLEAHLRETERQALLSALQHARNNRTLAARLLGVSRRTFYNRLQEHGMT